MSESESSARGGEAVRALLAHPDRALVRFSVDCVDEASGRRENRFRVRARGGGAEERAVPGITAFLRKHLWPAYAPFRTLWPRAHSMARGVCGAHEALTRGTLVHEQLAVIVNESVDAFHRRWPREEHKHRYTHDVRSALHAWRLQPVRAELVVYEGGLDLATSIDMVCADTSGAPVLIELKTGSDTTFCQGSGTMAPPLHTMLSNSPKNQAAVQLLVGWLICERAYGCVPAAAYIVNVNADGVHRYPIPPNVLAARHQLYDILRAWRGATTSR